MNQIRILDKISKSKFLIFDMWRYVIYRWVQPMFSSKSDFFVEIDYNPDNGGMMNITVTTNNVAVLLSVPEEIPLLSSLGVDPSTGLGWIGFTASHAADAPNGGETITVQNWAFEFLGTITGSNCVILGDGDIVAGEGLF